MDTPIIIDGKDYEKLDDKGLLGDGYLLLKPLPLQPKQPEEEKFTHDVKISCFGTNSAVLQQVYYWTPHQAQLAADAVKEVLRFIQGDTEKRAEFNITADKARDAIKDSE